MIEASNQPRIDTLQSTELAEGVEVHARVAGVFPRAVAHLVDIIFLMVMLIVLTLVWVSIGSVLDLSTAGEYVFGGIGKLGVFCISWFYFFIFERSLKGATWGKMIMGLKVVSSDGSRVTAKQAFVRNLLRVADLMPGLFIHQMSLFLGTYGLGMIACLFTKKFQRVGDLVADTIVVYSQPPRHIVAPLPPAIEAKIPRAFLTREEEVAIRSFTERAGIWSEARRLEMSDHASGLTQQSGYAGLTELQSYSKSIAERK